jgi:hypothetical protein
MQWIQNSETNFHHRLLKEFNMMKDTKTEQTIIHFMFLLI